MPRIETKRLWAVYVKPNGATEKLHSLHSNKLSANRTALSAPLSDSRDWHGDYRVQEHLGRDLPLLLGL